MRVLLKIAYDGTAYSGWQVQKNAPSVQQTLQKAIEEYVGHDIQLTGASRTDAGVHAIAQMAVFDTDKCLDMYKTPFAINARLPEDIAVQEARIVPDTFHPRYLAHEKVYRYRILYSMMPLPTERFFSYHVYGELSVDAMRSAAQYLKGKHDFRSFCPAKTEMEDTVRTIYDIDVSQHDSFIDIIVSGNGFLHNMVRIIAGTLIDAGRGKFAPEDMIRIIEARDRNAAGHTAPPQGLTLMEIRYDTETADQREY